MPKASPAKAWDKSCPRSGRALLCGRAVCERLGTVIRTDEPLSPKPPLADGKPWAVLKSPDELRAFWRGAASSVCAQAHPRSVVPERRGQLAAWLTFKLVSPLLAITSHLQHTVFVYETPQIPATAIATRG